MRELHEIVGEPHPDEPSRNITWQSGRAQLLIGVAAAGLVCAGIAIAYAILHI